MSTQWKNVDERGSYWGIKFVTILYRYGGHFLVTPIVYVVVFYFFLTRSSTRRHSKYYLDRVAKLCSPEQIKKLNPWRHYLSFGSSLLDRIAIWMDHNEFQHIEIPNQALFLDICAKAPGAVVLTSHTGNFEMLRALTNDGKGVRANIVMDTGRTRSFAKVIQQLETDSPINLIPTEELTAAMAINLKHRLDEGECLFIMADRQVNEKSKRSIQTTLLGSEAQLPQGPFRLALSLECPVFFMSCVKKSSNQFLLVIDQLDTGATSEPKKDRMHRLGRSYVDSLEAICKEYPLQWFNFYDYWHDDPKTDTDSDTTQRSVRGTVKK